MSKVLEIRLTPLEPFFLGSDRTFFYGEKDIKRVGRTSYYVRSERIPMQTTLFGVMRYLGIRDVKDNYDITNDAVNIGSTSFKYSDCPQTFGRIESISPLYLLARNRHYYMPIPMDHKMGEPRYTPFSDYREVRTTVGSQLLPVDYDAKAGTGDGFVDVNTGEVISQNAIFSSLVKTGIDINRKKEGYFKMEYIRMNPEYCFSFRAKVKEGFPEIDNRIVYMGGRKSAFLASVTQVMSISPEEELKKLLKNHPRPFLYVSSDSFLQDKNGMVGIDAMENNALFSVVDFKTAREYVTNYGQKKQRERFTKSERLYRLIRAGSVFILDPSGIEKAKKLFDNPHFMTIGMNHLIIGGSENEGSCL